MHEEGQIWNPPGPDERFRLDRAEQSPELEFRPEECLPIVVGGMPRAEWLDRPYATRLARLIRAWQAGHLERGDPPLVPIVVTDLWFLNDRDLMSQPSIAIGDPVRNAVTAWQATRLPRSLVVDGVFAIHCDPEFLDGGVCLWGEGVPGLDAAFDAFAGRYLDRYLRQMHLAAT